MPLSASGGDGLLTDRMAAGRGPARVPWSTDAAWREVNTALRTVLSRDTDALNAARRHAAAGAHARDRLADLFDHLAGATCAVCPDPCCRHARVWLDFKDLLLLHLNGEALPPRQLRRDLTEPCRYLGSRGCRLPHRSRPWICSWYVCPALRRALERDLPGGWRQAVTLQAEVKARRHAMEVAFRSALGAGPGGGWEGYDKE
jgi:hypothetical protein